MTARAKILLVVNPAATAYKPKVRAAVEQVLSHHDLSVVETERRDHATDLARKAAADGLDAVVVLSGDGALNEAANGLVGTDTALAPLPGGSTNVFARTWGLARKPEQAAEQIGAALDAGSMRMISLGSANGRYFLVNCGIGFDAAVVQQAERHPKMKKRLGQTVFVYAANATWTRHYSHRKPHFDVELPDGSRVDNGYFSICLNSNPYTFLGPRPLNVVPGLVGDKGLSIVTLQSLKLRHLLGVTRRTLGSGRKVASHKKVQRRDELGSLTIVGRGPVEHQVDGDFLGSAERIELRHHPAALQVVVPGAGSGGPA